MGTWYVAVFIVLAPQGKKSECFNGVSGRPGTSVLRPPKTKKMTSRTDLLRHLHTHLLSSIAPTHSFTERKIDYGPSFLPISSLPSTILGGSSHFVLFPKTPHLPLFIFQPPCNLVIFTHPVLLLVFAAFCCNLCLSFSFFFFWTFFFFLFLVAPLYQILFRPLLHSLPYL